MCHQLYMYFGDAEIGDTGDVVAQCMNVPTCPCIGDTGDTALVRERVQCEPTRILVIYGNGETAHTHV